MRARDSITRMLVVLMAMVTALLCPNVRVYADEGTSAPGNGIPVLSITLEGEGDESPADAFDAINASPDHSVERGGTLQLDVPDGYQGDYSDVAIPGLSAKIEAMRGRGNSTWHQKKKPYKIKLERNSSCSKTVATLPDVCSSKQL